MLEIGIRVILGATTTSVVTLVARRTMVAVARGVVVGLGVSLVVTRMLAPYLFRVATTDGTAHMTVIELLAMAALLASRPPARRPGRIQPRPPCDPKSRSS